MRPILVILALAAGAAGCAQPPADSGPTAPARFILADSVDHIDALAREPMVVAHPGGALFVTGYFDSIPPVWKSVDNGATWSRVNVGTPAAGAAGNSDSDLAVGPDGTLYLLTLLFDRAAYRGVGIQVAVSHDVGNTWTWTQLSRTPNDDRPWIEVAPDGTAHAIWNDGAGVSHAMSTDSGRTWTERDRVNAQGGSSHLAVGPNGEIAVRIVPLSAAGNVYQPGVDLVAVSVDRGATWDRHPAPGNLPFPPLWDTTVTPRRLANDPQPRWVEPLAWDSGGALYSFWARDRGLYLARSRDRGATWTNWQVAVADSTPYFPYLIARGDGELAASWFSGHGDSLRVNAARIQVPSDDSPPVVALVPSFQPESFTIPGLGDPGHDTAGEYLPLVFLSDGSLGLVAPIQHFAAQRLGFSWRRYTKERPMNLTQLTDFATRYAAAWSSQNPDSLAAFYFERGSLKVNAGAPAVGREAVRATAQGFMNGFPDMVVRMDSVVRTDRGAVFHWTWTGTNTGPGGTGRAVRITGYEDWTFGPDGLIAQSLGHYDEAEYQRQVSGR